MDKPFRQLTSKNYDFLWEFGGLSYHYCSLYVDASYGRKRDFIWYSENLVHYLFISKKERKRLSARALKIYDNFDSYEKKVQWCIKHIDETFKSVKKQNLSKLTAGKLLALYKQTITRIIKLWDCYFWTEYFCTDKLAENNYTNRNNSSLSRVEALGKIKYLQRKWINRIYLALRKLEKEISRRKQLPFPVRDYHYKEIIAILQGKKVTIPVRNPVIKGKFSRWHDIVGEEAQLLFRRLYKIDSVAREIRGKTGNKGFYRGTVKIIPTDTRVNYSKTLRQMKKGQVLVSGTTGPDLILACKKAGAIVTEEGGIISHAAVISRELDIPCVVGTRIATKILKDNDVVEVDATKGIVKIIQSTRTTAQK